METNKIIHGNCLEVLNSFPNASVDCIITSPPYWQLRDYGWSGQWGLEPTYSAYLENLWLLMNQLFCVLKPGGTCWINLGDTYGTQSGNMRNPIASKETNHAGNGINIVQPKTIHKCLLLIPHRFAIGCIERGWIVRNDIIWAKRNGMPESVTDRFSKKHEYFFFMVRDDHYYFDLEAVKDRTLTFDTSARDRDNTRLNNTPGRTKMGGLKENNYSTKNPGTVSDFWDIPTKGNKENHFAQHNTQLIDKPIVAGCPEGGVILDPFCGTATTGRRAIELGRKFIGIEGNAEYVKIGNEKIMQPLTQQQLFTPTQPKPEQQSLFAA